jgi:hypothetical protein
MMNVKNDLRVEKACEGALAKFQSLGNEKYADIQSKLEYVLGSYAYDGNPVGLYEYAEKSLKVLKALKKEKPRSVSDKLIADLEKAVNGK